MRVIKIKIESYKFKELSELTQQKALEKLWDINVNYEWWDFILDDAKRIGLKIEEFDLDRDMYCRGKFLESALECAELIKKEHGDITETYKTANTFLIKRDELISEWPRTEDGDLDKEYELDGELDKLELEFLNNILEDYRILLKQEYKYLTSKESISDTIETNEYEFTKDGELI